MIGIPLLKLAFIVASWTGVQKLMGQPDAELDTWLTLIELRCLRDAKPYKRWPDVGL